MRLSVTFLPDWGISDRVTRNILPYNTMIYVVYYPHSSPLSHGKTTKHVSPDRKQDSSSHLPESAERYIQRVFVSCSSEADKDKMQELLRDKLDRIMDVGGQWEIDWDREPIPTLGSAKTAKSADSKS